MLIGTNALHLIVGSMLKSLFVFQHYFLVYRQMNPACPEASSKESALTRKLDSDSNSCSDSCIRFTTT